MRPAIPCQLPIRVRIGIACVLTASAACLVWWPGDRPAEAESASQSIDVVATIRPELSLTVEPETGSRIELGTIDSSPTESRRSRPVHVAVRVFSNLGRPYQVTQQLRTPLANQDGQQLAPEQLLVSQSDGSPEAGAPRGLAGAPQVVFASDAKGRSADRSLTYQLQVPPDTAAGDYQGTILMTVTAQ